MTNVVRVSIVFLYVLFLSFDFSKTLTELLYIRDKLSTP